MQQTTNKQVLDISTTFDIRTTPSALLRVIDMRDYNQPFTHYKPFVMSRSSDRTKKQEQKRKQGSTTRTSNQGRKESSGGNKEVDNRGRATEGNAQKEPNARSLRTGRKL
jgi:hypothetical protein